MVKDKEKPIIVITGASGNIGKLLTNVLKSEFQIVGLDQDEGRCDIALDLTSDASVERAFNRFEEKYGKKIAVVIHLAAYFDFTGEESPLYEQVNEKGTKRLLEILQRFEVERFIYSSTMLVHEPGEPGDLINEQSPVKAQWAYPRSKEKTEKIIEQYHGNIPYLIVRLAGLYSNETCIPTLAQQIVRVYERRLKSNFYAGDIEAGQSFIHEADLLSLFKKAIQYRNELAEEEIILAGEPESVSYKTLQKLIVKLIHEEKSKIYLLPTPVAKTGAWLEEKSEPLVPDDIDQGEKPFIRPFMIDRASDHYELDIAKARQLLHWQPEHQIKETLPELIHALKKDPKKWYARHDIILPDWMAALKSRHPEEVRSHCEEAFRKAHQQTLWAHFLTIALGFWLIISPFIFGYQSNNLIFSNAGSGSLIIMTGFLSLSWRYATARLFCATVGIWLLFSPLVFWAPTAVAYLNNTLLGAFVVGFSLLTRPEIGVAPNARVEGADIPLGWDFSPSSWSNRMPIIVLAFIGFFISLYLAAYQLGYIHQAWDPFFTGSLSDSKNGTEEIITSHISMAFPIPDAGLGAIVYLLEILLGLSGGTNRWRTSPWSVLLFAFLIIPLGIVSITFIVIQPILLGTWCTLCLIAATAMLLQIPYAIDEFMATITFLWRRWKAGRPLLRILFVGDAEGSRDKTIADNFEHSPRTIIKEGLTTGLSFSWGLVGCLLIGLWLMFTRVTLSATVEMANADHLLGSLIITISIISFAEIVRAVRWLNLIFATVLFITPFLYDTTSLAAFASILAGLLLLIFTIPRGKINSSYGRLNKIII
ncbi:MULTISPECIES: vitamin K epoxide reductase family protein [unclassified Legionella]|uniref:vitamin K epoxide reductase family protein n=1 Tax=unclassified Legionella TaxID=2622702 RepID=UPI0010565C03|nr:MULTISPECIES: vitamin K epoxide reductase family protein [unclassified Legionella]MDI9819246.1 vitamin K epoxide reductase family protein [Legionella sp. PL877]